MTRATNNVVWTLAIIVGAIVLAKKDEAAVPWALGVTAAIVCVCSAFAILAERGKI